MKSNLYLLLAALIAVIVLVLDLYIHLGVAFGVPYIIVVFIILLAPNRQVVIITAAVCTALVLPGFVFSPEGGET